MTVFTSSNMNTDQDLLSVLCLLLQTPLPHSYLLCTSLQPLKPSVATDQRDLGGKFPVQPIISLDNYFLLFHFGAELYAASRHNCGRRCSSLPPSGGQTVSCGSGPPP